jgi:uncharacterized protein (DUF488 family)
VASFHHHMHQLYTIGHGSRKKEAFLALLTRYGINTLIDVRSAPYSRFHPQFNQNNLKDFLEENNIRYVFMGDTLGGRPKNSECYTNGKPDYDKMKQATFYLTGITQLKRAVSENNHIAIMCSESKASECHRTKLIAESIHGDVVIKHIDKDGALRPHEEIMNEVRKPDLFS